MTLEQKALEYGEQLRLIVADKNVDDKWTEALIQSHVDAFIDGAKWMKEEMSKADTSES